MLLYDMSLSFLLGFILFILLIIRIEIGALTSEDTLHMIADRETGNREWREMQDQLPSHLIRSEADVYSVLPSSASLSEEKEVQEEDRELCIICMEKFANAVLLPCGHGGCCYHCSRLLYKQLSKRTCPLCRHPIEQVARIRDHSSKTYNSLPVYSVEKI